VTYSLDPTPSPEPFPVPRSSGLVNPRDCSRSRVRQKPGLTFGNWSLSLKDKSREISEYCARNRRIAVKMPKHVERHMRKYIAVVHKD
jgi:hypothetical protein